MRSVVAGVSLVYDLGTGVLLLVATERMASWFGVGLPQPVIFAKLCALFLIAVGLGYLQPLFNPDAHRPYLWIFGTFLKGAGALTFLLTYFSGGSPASFLLFALTDGALAAWTTMVLLAKDPIAEVRSGEHGKSAGVKRA